MSNKVIDKAKINKRLALILLGIFVSLPLLTDFLIDSSFTYIQLSRVEAIKDGLLLYGPSMWLKPDYLDIRGYSMALFYGDFFLLPAAVLRMVGMSVQTSMRVWLIVVNFLTVWSSYFAFSKLLKNEILGVSGSILYTASVYRGAMLYSEMELGTIFAYIFLPIALLGGAFILAKEKKDRKQGVAFFIIGFTGIWLSSLLWLIAAALLCIVLWLCNWKALWKKESLKYLGISIIGMLVANLSNLYTMRFYLQADVLRNPNQGNLIQKMGLQISQLFMGFYQGGTSHEFGTQGVSEAAPIGLGFVFLMVIVGFLYIAFFYGEKLEKEWIQKGWKLLIISLACIWMSLLWFPWDNLAGLSVNLSHFVSALEYPWLLLAIPTLLLSWLALLEYEMVGKIWPEYQKAIGIGTILVGALCSAYQTSNLLFVRGFSRINTPEELWETGVATGAVQVGAAGVVWYGLVALSVIIILGSIVVLAKNGVNKKQ